MRWLVFKKHFVLLRLKIVLLLYIFVEIVMHFVYDSLRIESLNEQHLFETDRTDPQCLNVSASLIMHCHFDTIIENNENVQWISNSSYLHFKSQLFKNHPTLVPLYVLNSIQIEPAHKTNVFKNMTSVSALYIAFFFFLTAKLNILFSIFFKWYTSQ